MHIADRSLKEFVFTAKYGDLRNNQKAKDRWHRLARRIIRVLAENMGLERVEYDLRTFKWKDSFPGETVFHAQRIYVKLEISGFSRDIGFMCKRCEGRKDFTGGVVHYLKWESLLDMKDVAARLLQHARGN